MNWIRAHFDRVAVLAGALFLLTCSALIWRSAASFNENFAASQAAGPPKPAAPPAQAIELQAAAEKLRQPPQWTFGGRSGLFVPEKHFTGPNGLPATLQTTEVHPPVPNEWLDQFGLPITEADVLAQDPDGDGFTNLEEWEGRTNPTEKSSHPAFIAKLKLKSFTREPFPFVFLATPGVNTFQLNYLDAKAPLDGDGKPRSETLLAILGKPILRYDPAQRKDVPTGFRVVNFTEKERPVADRVTAGTEDVSELTLENEKTKERVVLVKEKTAISPESIGTFVYSWGERREYVFKKDQEFSLPPETTIRYKLVDVQPGQAVIVNMEKPDERITISPLAP